MANVKISQLPATASPQGAGLIPIVQDGTTYSTTATDLVALAAGGVTSFNTRDGAVTLADTDVTGALGYTPVSPTTLADYVPEVRTLTINGTTQDLSANRTFTVETGAVTYPFTGSNIAEGDAVVINDDGTVSNILAPSITPSTTLAFPGNVSPYTITNPGLYKTIVCSNPNFTVTVYFDITSQTLNAFMTKVDGSNILYPNNSTANEFQSYGCDSFDLSVDPFNPDRILIIVNGAGNVWCKYLYINYDNITTYYNLSFVIPAFYLGFSFVQTTAPISFKFSEKYQNLITFASLDPVNGYPFVQSFYLEDQKGYNLSQTPIPGTVNIIDTVVPATYNYTPFELARVEGEDKFVYNFSTVIGMSQNLNVVLFTFDNYVAGTAPNMISGFPSTVLNDAYTVNSYFSSNKNLICCGVDTVSSLPKFLQIDFSGLVVGTPNVPSTYAGTNTNFGTKFKIIPFPVNKNYFIFYCFNPTTFQIISSVIKNQSSSFTYLADLVLFEDGVAPDLNAVTNFSAIGCFNENNNGTANFISYFLIGTYLMFVKTSPIKYIDMQFDNQNLLGVAQNTVTTSATVNVLPFGSVDNNQASQTTNVNYYLQDDGIVTTNVTPHLLGKSLSATSIKTANYPTL